MSSCQVNLAFRVCFRKQPPEADCWLSIPFHLHSPTSTCVFALNIVRLIMQLCSERSQPIDPAEVHCYPIEFIFGGISELIHFAMWVHQLRYKAGDGKVWLGLNLIKKIKLIYLISYGSFLHLYWISRPVLQMDQGYRLFCLKGKCQSPGDLAWARGLLKKQRKDGVGRSLPNGPATRGLLP